MSKTLTLGTRGSALAMIQTNAVIDALATIAPEYEYQTRQITTKGDLNHSPIPMSAVGKTWFTEEIERALIEGEIDLAVHSLKDLPLVLPERAAFRTVLTRADPRDALIAKHGATLASLPHGAIVGTDSIRRKALLLHARPDLVVKSVRGNVPTRLQKLQDEEYDALVLAAAGLERLGSLDQATELFDPSVFVPAVGQGILAVEALTDRTEVWELIRQIEDPDTARASEIEYAFARAIGGGCKVPIGCYASITEDTVTIHAMAGSMDPLHVVTLSHTGPLSDACAAAEGLAQELLQDAHIVRQLQDRG